MKRVIYFVSLVILVFSACNKQEDELTITMLKSGEYQLKLTYQGKAIKETEVILQVDEKNHVSEIARTRTNAEGIAVFGNLNEGNYTVQVKNLEIDSRKIYVNRFVQVISGNNKKDSLEIAKYLGKIKLLVVGKDEKQISFPVKEAKVALIPEYINTELYTHDEIVKAAIAIEETNVSGVVTFEKISCDFPFKSYVYYSDKENELARSADIEANCSNESRYKVEVFKIKPRDSKIKVNVRARACFTKNEMYGEHSLKDLKIAIVTREDLYNNKLLQEKDFSKIVSRGTIIGKTNEGGIIELDVLPGVEYFVIGSFDGIKYDCLDYPIVVKEKDNGTKLELLFNAKHLGL